MPSRVTAALRFSHRRLPAGLQRTERPRREVRGTTQSAALGHWSHAAGPVRQQDLSQPGSGVMASCPLEFWNDTDALSYVSSSTIIAFRRSSDSTTNNFSRSDCMKALQCEMVSNLFGIQLKHMR